MGGEPEPKKQLGKIMLQRKLVTADELSGMLAEQEKDPETRLASVATRIGMVSTEAALSALSEQHGVPSVDLTAHVVPLSHLKLIPREIAEERSVFPFALEGDELWLAMANPGDEDLLEEIGFITNKKLVRHVALDSVIRQVITDAYAMSEDGGYYIGAFVSDQDLVAQGLSGAPRAAPPEGAAVDREVAAVTGEVPKPNEEEDDLADAPLDDRELFGTTRPTAPGEETAAAPRDTVEQPAPAFADAKVLIADTDSETRGVLRAAFEALGVATVEVIDGAAALKGLRDESPDVLVLDVGLPKVHGFDICRRLKGSSRFGNVKLILISDTYRGWRVKEDVRAAYGIPYFFEKPLEVPRLLEAVRAILEDRSPDDTPPPMSAEADAHWNRGMELFENGDLDQAIEELEAGVALEPDAFELCYHLGLLYGRRDDLFSAIHMLERAILAQPRHFPALKNLAVVYQRAGFRRKSMDIWQRAYETAPDRDTRVSIKDLMLELLQQ